MATVDKNSPWYKKAQQEVIEARDKAASKGWLGTGAKMAYGGGKGPAVRDTSKKPPWPYGNK